MEPTIKTNVFKEYKNSFLIQISFLIVTAIIFLKPDTGLAQSNIAVGGESTQTIINFKIFIPQSISLSIGVADQEELSTLRNGYSKVVVSDRSVDDKRLYIKASGTLSKERAMDFSGNLPEIVKIDQTKQGDRQFVLCSP